MAEDLYEQLHAGFRWQVPGELDPGTYFIFAKIKNADEDEVHVSVAQGTIIVRDPANP